jgi:hypothetical protein
MNRIFSAARSASAGIANPVYDARLTGWRNPCAGASGYRASIIVRVGFYKSSWALGLCESLKKLEKHATFC